MLTPAVARSCFLPAQSYFDEHVGNRRSAMLISIFHHLALTRTALEQRSLKGLPPPLPLSSKIPSTPILQLAYLLPAVCLSRGRLFGRGKDECSVAFDKPQRVQFIGKA